MRAAPITVAWNSRFRKLKCKTCLSTSKCKVLLTGLLTEIGGYPGGGVLPIAIVDLHKT